MESRVFGELSQRAELMPPSTEFTQEANTLASEPIYVALALTLALLYMIWLPLVIKSRDVSLSRFMSSPNPADGLKIETVENQRIGARLAAWGLSVGLSALFVVRVLALFINSAGGVEWGVAIVLAAVAIVLVQLYGVAALKLGGGIVLQSEFVEHIIWFRRQTLIFGVVLLTPLYVICSLLDFNQPQWALQLAIAVVIALVLIFIRHTFLLFIGKNFSILHWFLYLCGVEILPVTFVWAVAVRAGVMG